MNEHDAKITQSEQVYHIAVGGTVDGNNTRDPVGYSNYGQTWENNCWVRMANTGTEPVIHPGIQLNDRPSWRSLEEILAGILTPAMDDGERARAIWEFARRHRYHQTTADDEVKDTVKMLNSYGYTLCWDEAYTVSNLWQAAGLKIRRGTPHGHCTTEVYFDGAYHLLDSDEHLLYLRRDNQTIASEADLARDHDLVKRGHVYGILSAENRQTSEQAASLFVYDGPRSGTRPRVGDHRMDLVLRPGEALTWTWKDRDKYHGYSGKPSRLCNGQLSFVPRLDQEFARWAILADNLQSESTGLVPIDPDRETQLVYRITSPYVIVGGTIEIAGAVAVELQRGNEEWQKVDGRCLDAHFPPASPACYTYALRLSGRGAAISQLQIDTDLQLAPLSLPALSVGNNKVLYTDASPSRQIHITHAWQERNDIHAPDPVAKPLYPNDGGTAQGTQFTFKWAPAPDAVDYQFELSPRKDMRYALSPVFEKITSKTPAAGRAEWTIPEAGLLNPGTSYYWRVRARSQAGVWGAWSAVWCFTPQAPGIPLDLALAIDTDQRTLTLHWRPNPDGQPSVDYEVYASDERGFTARHSPYPIYRGAGPAAMAPGNCIATTTDTALQVVGPDLQHANCTFYRVVAIDAAGQRSGPSDYVAAPTPFIYSRPPRQAIAGRKTTYPIQSLRSIGDLRSESEGPDRYFSAFRDGDVLRYILDEAPAFIALDSATGLLNATPSPDHLGFHTITFRVQNGQGGVDLQGFDLEVVTG